MRITIEQLVVGDDSPLFVVLLQLCAGYLVETVVGIVGLRITTHQRAEHRYFLAVFVLQSQCVTALEEGIVSSRRLHVAHLRVVGYSLRETAAVEIAVADTVERIGIGRVGSQRGVDIGDKRLACRVVFTLRESTVALQVTGDGVVVRQLGIGAREELTQVTVASLVGLQTIGCLGADIIGFGGIFVRLRCMIDDLRHPLGRRLYLALEERINAQLVTQILLGLQHLRRRMVERVERGDSRRVVLALHQRIGQETINLTFVFGVRKTTQEVVKGFG